jgi:hypothetical protein
MPDCVSETRISIVEPSSIVALTSTRPECDGIDCVYIASNTLDLKSRSAREVTLPVPVKPEVHHVGRRAGRDCCR